MTTPAPDERVDWEILTEFPTDPSTLAAWDELVAAQPDPAVFLTYDWLVSWWQHFGTDRDLVLIVGRRAGRLVALAPLMISRKPLYLLRAARVLEFIGTAGVAGRGMGLTDRADLLCLPDEPALLDGLVMFLMDHGPAFDLLLLRAIPEGSPVIARLERRGAPHGWKFRSTFRSLSPYTGIAGSWESYLATRTGKLKRGWKNSRRRLDKLGQHEISCYPDNGWRISQVFDTVFDINRRSYKWASRSSLFISDELRQFYRELFERLDGRGWFLVHFLVLDDRPVAYQLGFRFANRFYAYNAAYDQSVTPAHPGIHLVVHLIQRAFTEGMAEFDMMRGEEPYKQHWATGQRTELHLAGYRASPVSSLSYLLHVKLKAILKQNRVAQALYSRLVRPKTAGE